MTSWMPIMGTPFAVRFDALDERQAQANHSQSLQRLAERGGLDPVEAGAVASKSDYHKYARGKTSATAFVDMLAATDALSTLQATNTALQRELAELKATNAEMEKDAARYRWLRERHRNPYIQLNVPPYGTGIISGTECNEVIDAAIATSAEDTPRCNRCGETLDDCGCGGGEYPRQSPHVGVRAEGGRS